MVFIKRRNPIAKRNIEVISYHGIRVPYGVKLNFDPIGTISSKDFVDVVLTPEEADDLIVALTYYRREIADEAHQKQEGENPD